MKQEKLGKKHVEFKPDLLAHRCSVAIKNPKFLEEE